MNTLLLDTVSWDLIYDANGNIAMASEPYSLAQDAASEIRTFLTECFYDTTRGIDYFNAILGKAAALTFVKAQMIKAAERVPDVASAQIFLSSKNRTLSGQVQVTSQTGVVSIAAFVVAPPIGIPSPLPFGP